MSFFRNQILLKPKKFKNNYSFLFDGVDESININAVGSAMATTTKGTFSFWIKLSDATPAALNMIISFAAGDSTDIIESYVDTSGRFIFEHANNGVAEWITQTTNAAFSDNTWAHCCLVQDAISPVIYVNNTIPTQSFTVSANKTVWFNSIVLTNGRLGGRFWASGQDNDRSLVGNLDEVGFFNTNLTAGQISEIYNSGKPKNLLKHSATSNLVSYFRMGDGDTFNGTNWTLIDKKGTNNGTSTNMEFADVELDVV